MAPAVIVVLMALLSQFTARATLAARDFRGSKSSEKTGAFSGLKRPHSRRNPWQP